MGKALVTIGGIQFPDNSGDPLNGGLVYAFATGTSTPATTYQDSGLTTPHADPIVLDSYGRPPSNAIWVNEEVDLEVKTSAGVLLYPVDNFNPALSGFGGMSTKNSNVLVKTTTYSVGATDDGKLIVASTGTWTLTMLAAATAGDGFWFSFVNTGTGVITMDGNASETINGSTTLTFGPGEGGEFRCDGTNWRAVLNGAVQKLTSGTFSGASLNLASSIVTAFRKVVMVVDNIIPGTDNTDLYFRLSDDSGSTYEADASDYAWAYHSFAEGAGGTQVGDADDSEVEMFPGMGNTAGEQVSGEIDIYNPGASTITQVIWRLCGQNSTPSFVVRFGAGQLQAAGATTAFQLLPSAGTWNSGNYTLYGWRA